MDRNFKIRVNILISVIILVGFIVVGATSYMTYSEIIKEDIVNISKLTATNIYSDIRNELTKPIFVSLTMANDTFLKDWLNDEIAADDLAHHVELQQYLQGIRSKYNYDSVFLISELTKTYFHYNGINKVLDPENEHDQWYDSFIRSELEYDLDIDTDEANHNRLSVFVNCRILDVDGRLMGVTGVGMEIDQVQGLLKGFEENFNLEAILFSRDGLVQVRTTGIENQNVFNLSVLEDNKKKIVDNLNSLEVFRSGEEPFDGYYITRYIEDLNWYLLVKKDTSILRKSLDSRIISDFLVYMGVVLCVLIVANTVIKRNDRTMTKIMNMDQLTNLPNRRGFNERLESMIKGSLNPETLFVFVFDIDNFKKVNDIHGHLIGDMVLKVIGQMAAEVFSKRGVVCRWGGDEFAGFLIGEEQEAIGDIELFFKRIEEDPAFYQYKTTISMGITHAHKIDTADTLIYRADSALYEAKGSGKNRYVVMKVAKDKALPLL